MKIYFLIYLFSYLFTFFSLIEAILNEYPQAKIRRKKTNVYPCKPKYYYIKVGCKGHVGMMHINFVVEKLFFELLDQVWLESTYSDTNAS